MSRIVSKLNHTSSYLSVSLLIPTLWFAFGLRVVHLLQTNRIVDEYTSMLSIQGILEQGIPILPSGRFYGPKGLLHGYVGAFSTLVFGSSEFALCFQSIVAGVITVCYIYRVGRDWFSPTVGLSAAVALTWVPSAVQWGGRVRMYGLWQLLTLVGVHSILNGYLRRLDRRARVIGILAMMLSVLTHTLALFVLGGLVVGVLVSWFMSPSKSRPALAPSVWEVLAGLMLVIAIVAINPIGGPWGGQVKMSEIAQGDVSIQNVQERVFFLLAYTHEFVAWPLWPLAVFYAAGFVSLCLRWVRKSPRSGDLTALSLYVLVLCVWFLTSIMAHIQRDRYLYAIIPFFLLLALREFCRLVEALLTLVRLPLFRAGDCGVSTVVSLLLVALLAPSTIAMIGEAGDDLAAAYGYVRDHWSDGDVVAACHPVPSQWFLGRADYYVIEIYVGVRDGIDVWVGAPLVETWEKFATVLENHPRVWYVADDLCWEVYLGADFRQSVKQNMQTAFDQNGIQVFVSHSD
jgi:4-amino-4-deoxy-L-arabinose transferase-like glycosyltransferase